MNFASVRIITGDIEPLVKFYEDITGCTVVMYTPDFAELQTSSGTLAIGSINTLALFGGQHIAEPASNRSVIIEFLVEDVDKRYEEISAVIDNTLVQAPTTMPWGNRSLLFRDPDGNLVNLFTPVTPQARQKFGLSAI